MTLRKGAVILAAGSGMRLGGVAKALLAAGGGRTFLAQILTTARAAGLDRAIVVVSREGLAMMKRLAGRRQDLADVAKLEGNDDDEDT